MAYENYRYVSWAPGTPITGERLSQMSNNIEQVKEATDDNPRGIIQLQQVSTDVPNATGFTGSDFNEHELISLKEDPPVDKRVSLPENRLYKLSLHFPGITVKDKGAEDSTFSIKFYQGVFGVAGTLLNTWRITVPPFGFYDVAGGASVTTISPKAAGYPTRVGAGDYSVIFDSGLGLSGESFYVAIKRDQGNSDQNAPDYFIAAAGSLMQFYVEDVGGS
jgi:hypothetical protein